MLTSVLIGSRPAAGRLCRAERQMVTMSRTITRLLKPTSFFFPLIRLINLHGARLRLDITNHLLTGCRPRHRLVRPRLSRCCAHQSQSVAPCQDGSLRELIINEGRGEGRTAG